MPLLLVIVFIVVPLAELYVIIEVGGLIGVCRRSLLLTSSLLGAALLRAQGRPRGGGSTRRSAEGRVPAREIFDGALVIARRPRSSSPPGSSPTPSGCCS